MGHGGLMASVVLDEPSLGLSPILVTEIFRFPMSWLGRALGRGSGGRVRSPPGQSRAAAISSAALDNRDHCLFSVIDTSVTLVP
jgi:hypothetical protein